jgi:hypothetical protein
MDVCKKIEMDIQNEKNEFEAQTCGAQPDSTRGAIGKKGEKIV